MVLVYTSEFGCSLSLGGGVYLWLESGWVCLTPNFSPSLEWAASIHSMKMASEWVSEVTHMCLTLCDPMDYSLTRFLHPWDFPGKNTGVGCHFLLQEIFLTPNEGQVFLIVGKVSLIVGRRFTVWATREDGVYTYVWVCVCIYICHSDIKKNEIMPFAETWMDLETVIQTEVRRTNTVY